MADMIREDLMARLREIAEREGRSLDDVIAELEDEAEWETAVMTLALGDALLDDGSIDFAKLEARCIPMTLEELCPECVIEDEGIE